MTGIKEYMRPVFIEIISIIILYERYKSLDDIIDAVRESVDIIEVLKPVYNFKASE